MYVIENTGCNSPTKIHNICCSLYHQIKNISYNAPPTVCYSLYVTQYSEHNRNITMLITRETQGATAQWSGNMRIEKHIIGQKQTNRDGGLE